MVNLEHHAPLLISELLLINNPGLKERGKVRMSNTKFPSKKDELPRTSTFNKLRTSSLLSNAATLRVPEEARHCMWRAVSKGAVLNKSKWTLLLPWQ